MPMSGRSDAGEGHVDSIGRRPMEWLIVPWRNDFCFQVSQPAERMHRLFLVEVEGLVNDTGTGLPCQGVTGDESLASGELERTVARGVPRSEYGNRSARQVETCRRFLEGGQLTNMLHPCHTGTHGIEHKPHDLGPPEPAEHVSGADSLLSFSPSMSPLLAVCVHRRTMPGAQHLSRTYVIDVSVSEQHC